MRPQPPGPGPLSLETSMTGRAYIPSLIMTGKARSLSRKFAKPAPALEIIPKTRKDRNDALGFLGRIPRYNYKSLGRVTWFGGNIEHDAKPPKSKDSCSQKFSKAIISYS